MMFYDSMYILWHTLCGSRVYDGTLLMMMDTVKKRFLLHLITVQFSMKAIAMLSVDWTGKNY